MIKITTDIKSEIQTAIAALVAAGRLPEEMCDAVVGLEKPKVRAHGDLSTNVALVNAKRAKMAPRAIAEMVVERLSQERKTFTAVSVAGPGFINFSLAPELLQEGLGRILSAGAAWGEGTPKGRRVNVEFVSANPTGPLHVGHGRGAAVGDALARVMRTAGYEVTCEYYLNDAGRQVETLARSIWVRYLELVALQDARVEPPPFPEDGYQGEYVKEMAQEYLDTFGLLPAQGEPNLEALKQFGIDTALQLIKETLAKLGVAFDRFFSERSLHESGQLARAREALGEKGLTYTEEGALFFRSTAFGDEKDRVIVRANGDPTYFNADIAYHLDKIQRGYDSLIDIWGADHHDYVPRVKAAIEAFGKDPNQFEALLVQFVSLIDRGEKVSMGKRSGSFVTLSDLIDRVGADVTRWFFLSKSHDTALDFDLARALSADPKENPARYAQYGHARACSILNKARGMGFEVPQFDPVVAASLTAPEELALLGLLLEFPMVIQEAARTRNTNRVATYLVEISREFHSYYTSFKEDPILPRASSMTSGWEERWDRTKTMARLMWVDAFRTVTHNALTVLGLPAPEVMVPPKGGQ